MHDLRQHRRNAVRAGTIGGADLRARTFRQRRFEHAQQAVLAEKRAVFWPDHRQRQKTTRETRKARQKSGAEEGGLTRRPMHPRIRRGSACRLTGSGPSVFSIASVIGPSRPKKIAASTLSSGLQPRDTALGPDPSPAAKAAGSVRRALPGREARTGWRSVRPRRREALRPAELCS